MPDIVGALIELFRSQSQFQSSGGTSGSEKMGRLSFMKDAPINFAFQMMSRSKSKSRAKTGNLSNLLQTNLVEPFRQRVPDTMILRYRTQMTSLFKSTTRIMAMIATMPHQSGLGGS